MTKWPVPFEKRGLASTGSTERLCARNCKTRVLAGKLRSEGSSAAFIRTRQNFVRANADTLFMDRVLLRSSHELGRSLAGEDLNSLESSALGPQKDHTDVREKHTADFFTAGAAWAIKPLRTDAVSRGRSISLLTQETISHSISVRLCLSSKGP